MCHIFFIHSSNDGHLGCFQIFVIVNYAAVNIGMPISFKSVFLFSLGKHPEVKLMDHIVVLFLVF